MAVDDGGVGAVRLVLRWEVAGTEAGARRNDDGNPGGLAELRREVVRVPHEPCRDLQYDLPMTRAPHGIEEDGVEGGKDERGRR